MNASPLMNTDAEVYLTSRRRGLLPITPRPSGWRMLALFCLRPIEVLRLAAQRRRAEARAAQVVDEFLNRRTN